jgi:hypothetical protein
LVEKQEVSDQTWFIYIPSHDIFIKFVDCACINS